jgi:hypothetical protein
VKIKNSNSEIMTEIFEFVIKNMNSEYFMTLVLQFLQQNVDKLTGKQNEIDGLKELNFYRMPQYDFEESSNKEILAVILSCAHIQSDILIGLGFEDQDGKYKDFGKMERQISPPVEAYKYVPFNKMKITESRKSYGLLFE